jgi:hypothetical protein
MKTILKINDKKLKKISKLKYKFGGAAEIWTQVARPPVLQDGPGYPTAPQSGLCFINGKSLSLPSSTIVIKYVV